MICGRHPGRPWRDKPRELSQLCCHEIANGPNRQKALDKPYAILVLCWFDNGYTVTNKAEWPEARQLAVLLRHAPEDFDLKAYLELTSPNALRRIEMEEIERWNH